MARSSKLFFFVLLLAFAGARGLAQSHFAVEVKRQFGLTPMQQPFFHDHPFLGVALVDLDRDGDLDVLAIWRYLGLALVSSANDGGGVFGPFVPAAIPGVPAISLNTELRAVDISGDGVDDIVLYDGQLRGWLNLSSGWAPIASMPTLASTSLDGVVFVDIDGDGDRDCMAPGPQLWIYQPGGYVDETATRMPGALGGFTVGDLEPDGDIDVIISNGVTETTWLNNGYGMLSASGTGLVPRGANPGYRHLYLHDIDGDGDSDSLSVFKSYPRETRLYVNVGFGVCVEQSTRLPPGWATTNFELDDVDGDGFVDLVAGGVYRNDGLGFFLPSSLQARVGHFGGEENLFEARGDVNGDGKKDRVVLLGGGRSNTSDTWGTAQLYINDRNQAFVEANSLRLPVQDRVNENWTGAALDVDADGDQDLLLSTGMWRNRGNGWFDAPLLTAPHSVPGLPSAGNNYDLVPDLDLADVDGDGDLDLVGSGQIAINQGNGVFVPDATGRLVVAGNRTILGQAVGDFDRDGDLDLVLASDAGGLVYQNGGTGVFNLSPSILNPATLAGVQAAEFVDVDRDGDLDLLMSTGWFSGQSSDLLYLNSGAPAYLLLLAPGRLPPNLLTSAVRVADFNGDAAPDLLREGPSSSILMNNGAGSFSQGAQFGATRHAVLDMDEDGDLDVVAADSWNGNRCYFTVHRNNSAGGFLSIANAVTPMQTAVVTAMLPVDLDQDGDLDIVATTRSVYASPMSFDVVLSNRLRHLESHRFPQVGRPHVLEASSQPGYATETQLMFLLGSLVRSGPYQPLPPFGRLGLDPATMQSLSLVTVPPPTGSHVFTVQIPNAPSLVGTVLAFQALVGPTSDIGRLRLTNVVAESILP